MAKKNKKIVVEVAEAPAVSAEKQATVVTGSGTWRDGMNSRTVVEWEKWATDLVAEIRGGRVECAIKDDALLAEMLCATWKQGNGKMRMSMMWKLIPGFAE